MAAGSEGSRGNPSLGAVLDGAEEPILTIKESSPSVTEHLIDGVPAAQAFRHREVTVTTFKWICKYSLMSGYVVASCARKIF